MSNQNWLQPPQPFSPFLNNSPLYQYYFIPVQYIQYAYNQQATETAKATAVGQSVFNLRKIYFFNIKNSSTIKQNLNEYSMLITKKVPIDVLQIDKLNGTYLLEYDSDIALNQTIQNSIENKDSLPKDFKYEFVKCKDFCLKIDYSKDILFKIVLHEHNLVWQQQLYGLITARNNGVCSLNDDLCLIIRKNITNQMHIASKQTELEWKANVKKTVSFFFKRFTSKEIKYNLLNRPKLIELMNKVELSRILNSCFVDYYFDEKNEKVYFFGQKENVDLFFSSNKASFEYIDQEHNFHDEKNSIMKKALALTNRSILSKESGSKSIDFKEDLLVEKLIQLQEVDEHNPLSYLNNLIIKKYLSKKNI